MIDCLQLLACLRLVCSALIMILHILSGNIWNHEAFIVLAWWIQFLIHIRLVIVLRSILLTTLPVRGKLAHRVKEILPWLIITVKETIMILM